MKTLKVTSIKKNKIKNIYLKVERKKSVITCAILGCFISIFSFGVAIFGNSSITDTYASVYNPFNTLYNSFGDVIFTSTSLNLIETKNLKLMVPVKCSDIESENGELEFLIDNSIMVKACEDGIVTGLGVLPTGEKYIEIKHNASVVTRYLNIDITGVVINQLVKKGKDIATAKPNEYLKLSVFIEGVSQNLSVNKNQVVWES